MQMQRYQIQHPQTLFPPPVSKSGLSLEADSNGQWSEDRTRLNKPDGDEGQFISGAVRGEGHASHTVNTLPVLTSHLGTVESHPHIQASPSSAEPEIHWN